VAILENFRLGHTDSCNPPKIGRARRRGTGGATGLRVAACANRGLARVGDPVRTWLHGPGTDNIVLVRMEPW
jgi:hypothetical protein